MKTPVVSIIGTVAFAAVAAGASKFSPGTVIVGGEIGRRMSVAAEKILHHTDVDNVFVRPFREHESGTYGGFVGYGMLLDAVVQAAAHGIGGEEMVAFKTRRLAEIAATATPTYQTVSCPEEFVDCSSVPGDAHPWEELSWEDSQQGGFDAIKMAMYEGIKPKNDELKIKIGPHTVQAVTVWTKAVPKPKAK